MIEESILEPNNYTNKTPSMTQNLIFISNTQKLHYNHKSTDNICT